MYGVLKVSEKYDAWDYITREDVKVIDAVNKLKKLDIESTKIVTNYMEKLVGKIAQAKQDLLEKIDVEDLELYKKIRKHRSTCRHWGLSFCLECFGGGLTKFTDKLKKELQGGAED